MNPRKHITRWFITIEMRHINLEWVTHIEIHYKEYRVVGATVYIGVAGSTGQPSIHLAEKDAIRLIDHLK